MAPIVSSTPFLSPQPHGMDREVLSIDGIKYNVSNLVSPKGCVESLKPCPRHVNPSNDSPGSDLERKPPARTSSESRSSSQLPPLSFHTPQQTPARALYKSHSTSSLCLSDLSSGSGDYIKYKHDIWDVPKTKIGVLKPPPPGCASSGARISAEENHRFMKAQQRLHRSGSISHKVGDCDSAEHIDNHGSSHGKPKSSIVADHEASAGTMKPPSRGDYPIRRERRQGRPTRSRSAMASMQQVDTARGNADNDWFEETVTTNPEASITIEPPTTLPVPGERSCSVRRERPRGSRPTRSNSAMASIASGPSVVSILEQDEERDIILAKEEFSEKRPIDPSPPMSTIQVTTPVHGKDSFSMQGCVEGRPRRSKSSDASVESSPGFSESPLSTSSHVRSRSADAAIDGDIWLQQERAEDMQRGSWEPEQLTSMSLSREDSSYSSYQDRNEGRPTQVRNSSTAIEISERDHGQRIGSSPFLEPTQRGNKVPPRRDQPEMRLPPRHDRPNDMRPPPHDGYNMRDGGGRYRRQESPMRTVRSSQGQPEVPSDRGYNYDDSGPALRRDSSFRTKDTRMRNMSPVVASPKPRLFSPRADDGNRGRSSGCRRYGSPAFPPAPPLEGGDSGSSTRFSRRRSASRGSSQSDNSSFSSYGGCDEDDVGPDRRYTPRRPPPVPPSPRAQQILPSPPVTPRSPGGRRSPYISSRKCSPSELDQHECRSSYLSPAPMIEIESGVYEPLRGSKETLRAAQDGEVTQMECICCKSRFHCIRGARYVICPACRVISPVPGGKTGVGLGFCQQDLQLGMSGGGGGGGGDAGHHSRRRSGRRSSRRSSSRSSSRSPVPDEQLGYGAGFPRDCNFAPSRARLDTA